MRTERQIRTLADVSLVSHSCKRVLTLFSGGLDSTYVLQQLAHKKTCEVIALTVDLGDGVDAEELCKVAAHFNARSVVVDGKEAFANDAVLPAIRANARYMSMYPISSSLSRPIIARYAVDLADKLGCGAIVHTANQSQNTLRRLNGAIYQLGYKGYFGTPYEFSAITREEKIRSLEQNGLAQFQARGVSGDSNLWCREFESGSLDNPESFWAPESLFLWTAGSIESVSSQLSLTFHKGVPTALDGIELPLVSLIARLNRKVGSFGIGRYSGLEHLEQGEKVLEVREAPAAHILMDAFRQLETAILDAELLREKLALEQLWVREAIEGRWYGDLRVAVDSFMAQTARHITGVVEYQLRSGAADVCSIRASGARYLTDRDAWEKAVAAIRGRRSLAEAMHGLPSATVHGAPLATAPGLPPTTAHTPLARPELRVQQP
ncbi:MAG: Argininosuccinate synthase [Pseudomonadota bacterium]